MKITNKDTGPRGFWRGGKLVMLDKGESVDVTLTAEEKKAADSTGFFAFGAAATKAEKKADDDKAED